MVTRKTVRVRIKGEWEEAWLLHEAGGIGTVQLRTLTDQRQVRMADVDRCDEEGRR